MIPTKLSMPIVPLPQPLDQTAGSSAIETRNAVTSRDCKTVDRRKITTRHPSSSSSIAAHLEKCATQVRADVRKKKPDRILGVKRLVICIWGSNANVGVIADKTTPQIWAPEPFFSRSQPPTVYILATLADPLETVSELRSQIIQYIWVD